MPAKITRNLAALCGALLILSVGAPSVRAQFGELTLLRGGAVVMRGALEIPVTEKLALLDGDRVKTLADSKAHIRLTSPPSGAEAIVTSLTSFAVHELTARRRQSPLQLLFGAIRSRVPPSFRSIAFMASASAVVGIKGTDFIVYVKRKEATEFIGVEGLIEAVSKSRPEFSLRIGKRQWGEIVEGEKPKPPVRVPDDDWEAALREFSFPQ